VASAFRQPESSVLSFKDLVIATLECGHRASRTIWREKPTPKTLLCLACYGPTAAESKPKSSVRDKEKTVREAAPTMTPKLSGMERSEDIRQADILRIVRERLDGFKIRQRGREQVRAMKRRPKSPPKEEQEIMFP
jgi:hypothetical protein